MRTTVDLPQDLIRQAPSFARDRGTSFSEAVAELMRRGLGQAPSKVRFRKDSLTGLVVTDLGQLVTSEDVRALEDE